MDPNPVLKRLGFSDDDRIVIIHTDDIGMCQASVSAFEELWDVGIISSGSTMVPCPWFLAVARLCRLNPRIDMGVHVTLTSEWETYRWGPISTRDPDSGLIDTDGYFFRSSEEVQVSGDPVAVQVEITAQIERALSSGIDATHVDTHMGSVGSIEFIPSYLQSSRKFGLPPMIMRLDKESWTQMGFDVDTAELAVQMVHLLEEQGVPLLDRLSGLDLDKASTLEERVAYAKQTLSNLDSGITHYIIHPSKDTPELRAITPDWFCRVADYAAFKDDGLRDYIEKSGLQVIGYRTLKDLL
jgi:predicted glycoside hydrolase/deacetylase ChbG (UPF0249 family)